MADHRDQRFIDSNDADARRLTLHQGDITQQVVDVIVNAANSRLAGGGGVDGAIHHRGGPSIMEETQRRYPQGCPTGSAVITSAGELQAKFVIHTVGPFWSGGQRDEAELLRSAYTNSLRLAADHGCRSIAFPSLSTGAYRYPMAQAAEIALACCWRFLRDHDSVVDIRFVLFDAPALRIFRETLPHI